MTKSEQIMTRLREDWTSLDALVAETEWQPHTLRAFLSRAKKGGTPIERQRLNGVTSYRVSGQ